MTSSGGAGEGSGRGALFYNLVVIGGIFLAIPVEDENGIRPYGLALFGVEKP